MVEIMNLDKNCEEYSCILAKSNSHAKHVANQVFGKSKRTHLKLRAILRGEKVSVTPHQRYLIDILPETSKQIIATGEAARNHVILAFQPLLKSIARKFVNRNDKLDVADLVNEACLIAIKAIYGYDNTEAKFYTYLRKTVCNELSRYVQMQMAGRIGSRSEQYLGLVRAAAAAATQITNNGQKPTFESVLDIVKTSVKIPEIEFKLANTMRQVTNVGHNEDGCSLSNDESFVCYDYSLLELQGETTSDKLDEIFEKAKISHLDQQILLHHAAGMSYDEIAFVTKMDVALVRKIVINGRKRMRLAIKLCKAA